MKNVAKKWNKVGFIAGGIILCLFFTACENFMKGNDIKEELEYKLYVNNHECPVATVEEPAYLDAGVARNKAIKISFTMPMDPATFKENYSILDASDNDLSQHFLEPTWSNDNKVVTIVANEQNPIDLRGKKTMDIYFKLSKDCKTPDLLPIKDAINHRYRINDELDETPPTISNNSYAEKPAVYFKSSILTDSYKLIEGEINKDTEKDICWNNHLNTKVKFYIEGNDYGGGDVYGHVIWKRIRDVNGNDVSQKETERSYIVENFKDVAGTEQKAGEFLLDLSSSEYNDGLYEIKVYIQDATGTDSEECKVYYAIRDTTFEYFISSRMFSACPRFRHDLTPGFDNPPNYVSRDLIDPDHTDTYFDDSRWQDPSDSSKVRYDFESESLKINNRWYWGPETADDFAAYDDEFDRITPTKELIELYSKNVSFQMISDDVFYKSKLTNKDYTNHDRDYSYFLSWGKSVDDLTEPVKITGYTHEPTGLFIYDLPQAYLDFYDANRNIDVILCATISDVVGNTNTLINLYPKDIEFYSYSVSDSTNGKKKVTLHFSESAKIDYSDYYPLPDKKNDVRYKIFYGKHGEKNLTKNSLFPLEKDLWSNETDNNVIDNLEPNTLYDVYIQPSYNFDSKTNGIWNGSTVGHLTEILIDTGKTGDGNLQQPVIEKVTKESEGINTGLFKITVTLSQDSYNTLKQYESDTGKKVSLIPSFNPIKEFDKDRNLVDGKWTYFESQKLGNTRTITFTVKNPLRAPFAKGDAWALPKNPWPTGNVSNYEKWQRLDWDGPLGDDGYVHGDYTYFQAVEACKAKYGYPYVKSNIKIIVTDDDNNYNESEIWGENFTENDDNIPPKMSSDVARHDGRLSYDGHSFEFEDLVIENEGHLSEYFNYYYMPYNPSWGDNLPEATEEIESLPGGVAAFKGSTYLDDVRGAEYSLPMTIPVFGLEDGEYMFFAKVSDTYGNYTYITLGKVNIGTFKNKLKVELIRTKGEGGWDPDTTQRHFLSTLQLEADEQNFERNMINLEEFADYKDDYTGKYVQKWGTFYGNLNALQECMVINGGTTLKNYNPEQCPDTNRNRWDDKDVFFIDDWDDEHDVAYEQEGRLGYPRELPKNLYSGHWFRLTLQSFNENYIIPGVREDGVDKIYGRPYHYRWIENENAYNIWTGDVKGYIEGETKYDVCTQETVSNTVYFYTPGEWWDEWDEYNEWDEYDEDGTFVEHHKDFVIHHKEYRTDDFSNFHASFFSSNAKASSNYPYLINVIASARDLGNDVDEWERRGKVITTRIFSPGEKPKKEWYLTEDENGKFPGDQGYIETWDDTVYGNGKVRYENDLERYNKYNPEANPFDYTVAQQDMADSKEKGFVYYVAVVHFADGSSAISDTYTMFGF